VKTLVINFTSFLSFEKSIVDAVAIRMIKTIMVDGNSGTVLFLLLRVLTRLL